MSDTNQESNLIDMLLKESGDETAEDVETDDRPLHRRISMPEADKSDIIPESFPAYGGKRSRRAAVTGERLSDRFSGLFGTEQQDDDVIPPSENELQTEDENKKAADEEYDDAAALLNGVLDHRYIGLKRSKVDLGVDKAEFPAIVKALGVDLTSPEDESIPEALAGTAPAAPPEGGEGIGEKNEPEPEYEQVPELFFGIGREYLLNGPEKKEEKKPEREKEPEEPEQSADELVSDLFDMIRKSENESAETFRLRSERSAISRRPEQKDPYNTTINSTDTLEELARDIPYVPAAREYRISTHRHMRKRKNEDRHE